ncbi:hypothetical protein JB92DRAFT_2213377 [Gautieria morchelliformis]|nr:hypothetical protein JB92DRAFT_2213377 [Gautieria morchelliformis]
MSRPSLCLLIFIAPFIIAHAGVSTLSPRQDVPAVSASLSTPTSSFNWWPYPGGGEGLSTSLPIPTLMSMTSTSMVNSSANSTIPLSSTSHPTLSSHSSPLSQTRATVSTSPLATSPPSEPQSLLKPGQIPFNPLWLVPLCLVSGAVIGCAVGWLAWHRCGEKRDRIGVGRPSERYARTYKHETEPGYDDDDGEKDEESGYSHDYSSLGQQPAYPVERNLRMPSTASTSGVRTWVGHPQARKRSLVFNAVRTSTDNDEEHDGPNDVKSPLLTQSPSSEAIHHWKPMPGSPPPSEYCYGDNERDDLAYDLIRHKSVRGSIWEQLGFAEAEDDLGRKKTMVYDGEGRRTWSAGATQKHIGRSLSFLARRKTMKEGLVERWIRSMMDEEGHMSPGPVRQQEAPSVSMNCDETAPHPGTPESVSSTLCRASSSTLHSPYFDEDPVIAFNGNSLKPHPSMAHHLNPTVASQPVAMQSGQRGSLPHTEQRSRGVSLRDPASLSGCGSTSVIMRPSLPSRNAFPLRSTTSPRSKYPQRSISSPTPPSPSSVSGISPTPHITAFTSLNCRPTRSTASRNLCSTLTRAPPSRLARPVSNTTRPARDSSMLPRNGPLPSRGRHNTSHQHLTSELPPGPSSLASPPLQSALCFDETLLPLTAPSRASTIASMAGTKLPTSSGTHRHSVKRVFDSGSIPPNARARTPRPLLSQQSLAHTPSSSPAPRPLSAKERYLAWQDAYARVGMIVSQSYNTRSVDEHPVSPTMFGAVINEEVEGGHLADSHTKSQDSIVYRAEGGEGIEQRLDTLGRNEQGGLCVSPMFI